MRTYPAPMTRGFTVRAARQSDAPAIARVHVESWRAGYGGLLAQELLEKLSVRERERIWRGALADDDALRAGRRVEVAVAGEAVVGFVSAGPSREHDAAAQVGEIYAIYVAPEHWSSGIGQALLNSAIGHLEAIAMREALVWVLVSNARAAGSMNSQAGHATAA